MKISQSIEVTEQDRMTKPLNKGPFRRSVLNDVRYSELTLLD